MYLVNKRDKLSILFCRGEMVKLDEVNYISYLLSVIYWIISSCFTLFHPIASKLRAISSLSYWSFF